MNLKAVGYSLAGLSVALGAVELLAGKRLASSMGVQGHSGLIRAFGLRELASGAALAASPTASRNAWARVAGDLLDLGALAFAFRAPGAERKLLWGSVVFVAGALVADVAAASAMRRAEQLS